MPTVQSRRPTHAATAPPVVATAVSESPARRRLAPEARATQILDVAARLLMDEGFTEVSMERMGREAGVSKALIYNYFPNRNDLLRALLEREVGALRQTQVREVAAAENFHDLVRCCESCGPSLRWPVRWPTTTCAAATRRCTTSPAA